ncbi:conserved hypothetical protein [Deferribacter desulfuricans SSM1]|uniref:Uncharacterized protein n=1 Tax=Deferribacter desulfuricans (strain DSM 14783 / JCM 11476 / NBRC 101012 / SSM1) TaxID=639282 RepID=D3PDR7_DEFDS|nr:hypothetical protein [Deferribacter desulfuricans]BAI80740.1 conserved hypothetical protein [Deferribacter desulfuricans SSM1]
MTKKVNNSLFIFVFILSIVLLVIYTPYFKKDMQNRPLFEKLGYTPQGKFYKAILGEYRWFMGEYLSFKAIIYYGGKVEKVQQRRYNEVEYYNLYRTIETSILLNPYNEDAYYFAQAAFTWDIGRVNEVNRLLEYVMKYRTWDFKIPFFIGFNYAYFLKDYKKAAKYYKKASEISKSPLFTKLAARYFYEGGETELGIAYLKTMIKITRKESIRKSYEIRLRALEAIYQIEQAVKNYEKKFGKKPKTIEDLVKSQVLKKIPVDPYGGKFYLDKDGKVRTTSKLAFIDKKGNKYGKSKSK